MLFYYDRYERVQTAGAEGFQFVGNRWPAGIDARTGQGAGENSVERLWHLITGIYGDRCADIHQPESCFFLRGYFGAVNATVAGIARMAFDGVRSGIRADIVVCVPENEQEHTLMLDPRALLGDLRREHTPGSGVRYATAQLPLNQEAGPVEPEVLRLAAGCAWAEQYLLIFDENPQKRVLEVAIRLDTCLPAERRKKFSFLTYTAQREWGGLYKRGAANLIGARADQENHALMEGLRSNGTQVYYMDFAAQQMHLAPAQNAAQAYLQRIYPMLLRNGELELPAQSGAWFSQSDFGGGRPADQAAQAAGLMLRAAKSARGEYYPLPEEKESVKAMLRP